MSELESTDLREKFNILSKTTQKEDKEEPRKQGLKLNVISGRTFGLTKEGTKIMSIISVAGHRVVKKLSEPSEITLVPLDIYADYLREKDPKLDSRAVRALLTTGGPRLMKVDGHYIEVHGPYPILMNVDGINIYTQAHVTDANDQIGRIYIGPEELKVRRIGHNAMLEQDAVHIICEADLAANVLDVQGSRHGSSGQRHASQNLDRYGFREFGSRTDKHQVGSCQSGSDLCDWTNPDHFTTAWRKTSLDELPSSG